MNKNEWNEIGTSINGMYTLVKIFYVQHLFREENDGVLSERTCYLEYSDISVHQTIYTHALSFDLQPLCPDSYTSVPFGLKYRKTRFLNCTCPWDLLRPIFYCFENCKWPFSV